MNRSLAYLRLGHYDNTIEDAGTLVPEKQKSEKGFYRAARAFYELGRFKECRQNLKLLLEHYPGCEEAKTELVRVEQRLVEREQGVYDFRAMYASAKSVPPHLDNATYIGPLEVKQTKDHGKGVFATKAVAAGELLLCEKAYAHCFAAEEAGANPATASKSTLLINTHTGRAVMGTHSDLITKIVQKQNCNPSLIPVFTSLYHGNYTPVEQTMVDGGPIIDTYVVS